MNEIDLRLMRAAVAIADDLNFSRAAVRLHISQPALTKQIQASLRAFSALRSLKEITKGSLSRMPVVYLLREQGFHWLIIGEPSKLPGRSLAEPRRF